MELAFALLVWSSAFSHGDLIPLMYTADGENISPPLQWECNADPESYAIICEDPDAPMGTWVHWVVYNIPGDRGSIDEAVENTETFENGITHGTNSWGDFGYGGPAPPAGKHRYFFTVYALDRMLDLPPGATANELREEMQGSVLVGESLMGEYARE